MTTVDSSPEAIKPMLRNANQQQKAFAQSK
jgi:hypothetical protein